MFRLFARVIRIARGIIGTALVWGVVFLPVALALGLYRAFSLNVDVPISFSVRIQAAVVATLVYTTWGALSGAAFGVVLALAERRRGFEELSSRRIAWWGALGAGSLPTVLSLWILSSEHAWAFWPSAAALVGISAGLGAACAGGTLALARRPRLSAPSNGSLTRG